MNRIRGYGVPELSWEELEVEMQDRFDISIEGSGTEDRESLLEALRSGLERMPGVEEQVEPVFYGQVGTPPNLENSYLFATVRAPGMSLHQLVIGFREAFANKPYSVSVY